MRKRNSDNKKKPTGNKNTGQLIKIAVINVFKKLDDEVIFSIE